MGDTKRIIVVDLDGTLALDHHRNHHLQRTPRDWDAYFAACRNDAPNYPVIALVQSLYECEYKIHIVTGRRGDCFAATVEWLSEYDIPYDRLQMRDLGERLDDHLLKRHMVDEYFDKILFVIEDRQRVVDMWRASGLTCLQCAPGNF
jgi:hypothetical protein